MIKLEWEESKYRFNKFTRFTRSYRRELEDVSIPLLGQQTKILDFKYVRENLDIMRNVLGVMILALTSMFIYKQALILVGD